MTDRQTEVLRNLMNFTLLEFDTPLLDIVSPDNNKSFEEYISGAVTKISKMFSIEEQDIFKEIKYKPEVL